MQNSLTTKGVQAGSVSTAEPEFVDVQNAVRFSSIGRTSLYGLLKDGQIKSISLRKTGCARGKRLIHLASLRAYLHSFGG
jgi:hypothetical protein